MCVCLLLWLQGIDKDKKKNQKKNKSRGLFSICLNNIEQFLETNSAKVSTMPFPHHLLRGSLLINVIKGLLVTQDSIKKINLALLLYFQRVVFPSVIFELKSAAALFLTHELF